MADPRLNDFIARMSKAFVPEKAAGLDTTIQLDLTGDHAGKWNLVIKDKQCTLNEGAAPDPKLTVSANSEDLMKIFNGQMDGMQAFMQGKLKLTGDLSVAMKLITLFKM